MSAGICRDPALVTSATLYVRTRALELYLWRWHVVIRRGGAR